MTTKENLGTFFRFFPVKYNNRYNVELNDNKGNVLVLKDPHFSSEEGVRAAVKSFELEYQLGKFKLDAWKILKSFRYGVEE